MKTMILCLLLFPLSSRADEPDDPTGAWVSRAFTMDAQDAEDLEKRVLKNPSDFKNHATLMIYYGPKIYNDTSNAPKNHLRHFTWMLNHDPNSKVFSNAFYPDNYTHKEIYELESAAWDKALRGAGAKGPAYGNAAKFFENSDHEKALTLLARATELDPKNPEWNFEAGRLMLTHSGADKALEQFELCIKKGAEKREPRWFEQAAWAAWKSKERKKAKEYAEILLGRNNMAFDYSRPDNEYSAYSVLGLVALQDKDRKTAKEDLAKLALCQGSPSMNSFGPNLELADAMLQAGESKSVIEFLAQISKFWKSEKPQDWIKQIQAGKKPKLDRFAREDKLIKAGEKAFPFTLKDLSGKEVSLVEALKKGPVILDFWATWCGPCRMSAPLLEEAVRKANEKALQPIQVLSIDIGEKSETVKKFVGEKDKNADYHYLLDLSKTVSAQYSADFFPSFVFIGKDGLVRESYSGSRPLGTFKKSAFLLAGKAYPGPPEAPVATPFVLADFNGNSEAVFGGGKLVVEDSCEPRTLSTLVPTGSAEGADKSAFLRWNLKLLGKAEGCTAEPWAWIRFQIPELASNLKHCAGVRFWLKSSKPGLICYLKLCDTDTRCGDKFSEMEIRVTAPAAWAHLSFPMSDFKVMPKRACLLSFDRVNELQIVTGGSPVEATLDVDQIEFY